MKKQLLYAALPVVALLATAAVIRQNNSIQIDSRSAAEVKIKANAVGVAQTGAWFVCADSGGTKFSLPASGIIPVLYGGTGGTNAATARASLGISESGTNSVLPVVSGGTGGTNAAQARASFGLAEWTTNATTVPLANGGTGAATAPTARLALGLGEWTTNATSVPLTAGGTGATTAGAARAALGISETATNSIIPVANGGTGAGSAAAAQAALGILSGSVTTSADTTITNTFATAFSAPPVVIIAQLGEACTVTNNLTSVTASNFVYCAGAPSTIAKWVAVGIH